MRQVMSVMQQLDQHVIEWMRIVVEDSGVILFCVAKSILGLCLCLCVYLFLSRALSETFPFAPPFALTLFSQLMACCPAARVGFLSVSDLASTVDRIDMSLAPEFIGNHDDEEDRTGRSAISHR